MKTQERTIFKELHFRILVIALAGFLVGALCCGTMLETSDFSIICFFMVLIGVVSLVIGWLVAGLVRKQRFVQVPRYSEDDTYDLEGEKPKRR